MGAEYRKWISSTRIHRWCYCHRGWILVNRWRQNEAFESRWLVSCTSPSWAQRKIWVCRMCFLGSESLIHGNSINLLLDNLQLTIINSKASPTIKLDVGVGIWTFSKNQFEPQAKRVTFAPDKWRGWVQNQRNCWRNCNLQFSFNYTKYYTFSFFSCKPLIYKDFWRARLSVNQRFSSQNFGRRVIIKKTLLQECSRGFSLG